MKIGWEKYRTVLKCTQMRACVEIVDVLGWNKSAAYVVFYQVEPIDHCTHVPDPVDK